MSESSYAKIHRAIAALLVSMAFLNSGAANAETDLSKLKCSEFAEIMQSKDHQQEIASALIMGYLWGLYKDEDEQAVVGTRSDNRKLGKLAQYCTRNPDIDVLTAADKAME